MAKLTLSLSKLNDAQKKTIVANIENVTVQNALTSAMQKGSVEAAAYGTVTDALRLKFAALGQSMKAIGSFLLTNKWALAAVGIAAVGTAIYAVIKHQERAREELEQAANEAINRIEEIKSAATSMSSIVDEANKSYAKLAQGVDLATGRNLTLDNTDYQEFLNISNQIADLFPTLPRVYDENGNAIVNLGNDAASVSEKLSELYDQQQRINDLEIARELPTIFDNAKASAEEYDDTIYQLQTQLTDLQKRQEYFNSDQFTSDLFNIGLSGGTFKVTAENAGDLNNLVDYYKDLFKDAEIEFEDYDASYMDEFAHVFSIDEETAEEIAKNNSDFAAQVRNHLAADFNTVTEELNAQEAKQRGSWTQFTSNLSSWLNTELASYALNDQTKDAIRAMVSGFDWQTLTEQGIISDMDDAEAYIRNHAIDIASRLPQDVAEAFTLKAAFESGSVEYTDYSEAIQGYLDTFAEELSDSDYKVIEDALGSELADAYEEAYSKAADEASMDVLTDFIRENAIDSVGELNKLIIALGDGTYSTDEMRSALRKFASDNSLDLLSRKIENVSSRMETYASTLDVVSAAQEELADAGVLTEETAASLQAEFGETYNVLKLTSRGWELNTDAIERYDEQQQAIIQGNILSHLSQLQTQLAEVDAEMADTPGGDAMMISLQNQRDVITGEIQELLNLQAQLNNLNSTYNKFIRSFSETDDWANYDTVVDKLEEVKDLANNGDWGDNSIRTFIEYITGVDASDLMGDDLRSAYASAMEQAEKYYSTGTEGIRNFVKAADEAGYVVDGQFEIDSIPKMAEDLNMTTDALYDLLNATQRTGDVKVEFSNWFPGANDVNVILENYKTLAALVKSTEESGGIVSQDTQDALSFYEDQLQYLKELQDQIISFNAAGLGQTTEWKQQLDEAAGYYGLTTDQILELNVNVNSEELQSQISQLAEENDAYVSVGMDTENSTLAHDIDSVVDEVRVIPVSISSNSMANMRRQINSLFGAKSIEITPSIMSFPSLPSKGAAGWSGTAAFNSGKISAGYRGPALVGELGKELLVRNGIAIPVGTRGAEMISVQKDDIIFNHKQTEQLEKYGHIDSRGKAFVDGTVPALAEGFQSSSSSGNLDNIPVSQVDKDRAEAAAKAAEKAAKASKDMAESSEDIYDYFERMIEVLEDGVDYIDAVLENLNGSTAKNPLIDRQMEYLRAEIRGYQEATGMYQELANQALAKLPADIQAKIVAGAVEVARYLAEDDETVTSLIDDYVDWDNKVQDCRKSIEEQTTALRKMAKLKFDNIIDDFEAVNDVYTDSNDLLDKQIGLIEESGLEVGEEFYRAQMTNAERLLYNLEQQRTAAVKAFEQALNSGEIRKGDEQYQEMLQTIGDIDGAIIDAKTDVEKFNNAVLQLKWDRFDALQEQFENIDNEISNLYDLFSDETDIKVSDRHGTWTDEALAQLGLLSQQYELNKNQSEQYAKAQRELEQMYKTGQYTTTEYIEKLAELKDGQWEAIDAYKAAEDAIMQLNEARVEEECEAIQEEIDAFKELTDAQIEALEAAEDLHDYQMSIKEQTKDIADIQRQLAAMQNDDTAATVAKRKQLEEQLAEAQQNLAETERDHAVEEQKNALNEQYEEYEKLRQEEMEALRKTLEDRGNIILQSMNQVKDNATLIGNEIDLMAKEHGVQISDAIVQPWKEGSGAIAGYNDMLSSSTSAFIAELDSVEAAAKRLQDRADEVSMALSGMFTAQAQSIVNELHSSYDKLQNVTTPADVWTGTNVSQSSGFQSSGTVSGNVQNVAGNLSNSLVDAVQGAVDELSHYTFSRPEPGLVDAYDGSGNHVGTYTLDEAKKIYGSMLKFADGGLITPTRSPLNRIARAVGEDTLVAAKAGEAILTPAQTKAMIQLAPMLETLRDSLKADVRRGMQPVSGQSPSVNINVDRMVNVEGSVDNDNADKIAKVAQNTIDKFMTKWNRDIKYNGYR